MTGAFFNGGAKNETFKMCFENVNETEKMVFFSFAF